MSIHPPHTHKQTLHQHPSISAGIQCSPARHTPLTDPWHFLLMVLSIVVAIVLLNGCDDKGTAAQPDKNAEPVMMDKVAPLYESHLPESNATTDPTTQLEPADAAGKAMDASRDNVGETHAKPGATIHTP